VCSDAVCKWGVIGTDEYFRIYQVYYSKVISQWLTLSVVKKSTTPPRFFGEAYFTKAAFAISEALSQPVHKSALLAQCNDISPILIKKNLIVVDTVEIYNLQ